MTDTPVPPSHVPPSHVPPSPAPSLHARRTLVVWSVALAPFAVAALWALVFVYAPLARARHVSLTVAELVSATVSPAGRAPDYVAVTSSPLPGQRLLSSLPFASQLPPDVQYLSLSPAGDMIVGVGSFTCSGNALPPSASRLRALEVPTCVHSPAVPQ